MKDILIQKIDQAVTQLLGETGQANRPAYSLNPTKDKQHGDFACNVALILGKQLQQNPREVATRLVTLLQDLPEIQKIDIAGPGFINFFVNEAKTREIVTTILKQKEQFGRCDLGQNKTVLLEYVSSNPTGPLHVGHGRSASFGAALASLLKFAGYKIHQEYYVNDAGRQMDILATSTWLRYLAHHGATFAFPSNAYKGDYVNDMAKLLDTTQGTAFIQPIEAVFENVPADFDEATQTGDKEAHIDALIQNAKKRLGHDQYERLFLLALNHVLDDIKDDLNGFGVHFDEWFSERALHAAGAVQHGIDKLEALGLLYKQDGALWFKSTQFGDEKDRVLLRANGQATYFAADVAYHVNKVERGFDLIIDIFGADHHGYVPRVRAAMQALIKEAHQFQVLLVQFALLYRGKERVQMSTRSGSFVTLRELREEVGNDATRFFYVMRRPEQHLDFDLELAKSKAHENPCFYIQYAHARSASILRQVQQKYARPDVDAPLDALVSASEQNLLSRLNRFESMIKNSALQLEVHTIAHYLQELAHDFHQFYHQEQVMVDDVAVRDARVLLVMATQQVIKNGLALLGVSAPEEM